MYYYLMYYYHYYYYLNENIILKYWKVEIESESAVWSLKAISGILLVLGSWESWSYEEQWVCLELCNQPA